MSAILTKNLKKTFRTRTRTVKAVKGVSLEVDKG